MTATAETIPQAVGDWTLRGRDIGQVFAASKLSDAALTAATRPRNPVVRGFPAYQLFARIARGDVFYDRELYEWVAGLVNAVVSAHSRKQRRPYVKDPGEWCITAGQDALAYAIHKRWPLPATVRAVQFNITQKTFQRVRDPIAGGILLGIDAYVSELTHVYHEVQRYDRTLEDAFIWLLNTHYQ